MFIVFILLLWPLVCSADLPELHYCTVASHETKGLRQLLRTCSEIGLRVDVLGLGLPYRGNVQRFEYIREYIKDLPDEDLILVTDAYDILVLGGKDEIIDRFLRFGYPCVFAAETNLYPKKRVGHLKPKFPKSPTKFKYLNGGAYMAYVGVLKKILSEIAYAETGSDQAAWIPYYAEHLDLICLDFHCELFLAMHQIYRRELEFDIGRRRVKCLATGSEPCVIHGNGMGKSFYQYIFNLFFN